MEEWFGDEWQFGSMLGWSHGESLCGLSYACAVCLKTRRINLDPDVDDGSAMSIIVVVEDSEPLNKLLCRTLQSDGHQVTGFLDAESLLESPVLKDTELIVLDVQLPGESGLGLAARLRKLMPNLGILMLTTRATNMHRIEGYDAGADYYLPKPVTPQELSDAVQSLLNRKRNTAATVVDEPLNRCVLARSAYAMSCNGRVLKLSDPENKILVALASAPGQQLEYWQILEVLNSHQEPVSRRTLDVRIHRLRAKLLDFIGSDNAIVSVRGVGYRLNFELEIR